MDYCFYGSNNVGSTVLLTDSTGKAVWNGDITPYGDKQDTTGDLTDSVFYTGKMLDPDTNLYYFNARWYDSNIGRFITEDPIKSGNNWYVYCSNNPLTFIDPTGLVDLRISFPDGQTFDSSEGFVETEELAKRKENTTTQQDDYTGYIDLTNASEVDVYNGMFTLTEDGLKLNMTNSQGKVIIYGMDAIPYIGDAKGIAEGFAGVDSVGNELAVWERVLSMICLAELKNLKWADEAIAILGNMLPKTDEAVKLLPDIKKIDLPDNIKWPDPNKHKFGFANGEFYDMTLRKGSVVDRYGDNFGRYVSPEGMPFDMRALPEEFIHKNYNAYILNQDIVVKAGPIQPHFGSKKGGVQYLLQNSVEELLDLNIITKTGN